MPDIRVIETGTNPSNGAARFTLKIDEQIVGENMSKIDVMMKVWSELDLPDNVWPMVKQELDRLPL